MQIIEQSVVPKNPTKRSEDGIVVTSDFVAVIDGSTSKSQCKCHHDYSLRRHSNGELAMLIISRYIKHMPSDSNCHQFCLGVTRAIRSHYKNTLIDHLASHPEDRLTASAVLFSRLRREIWMIGDCQAMTIPMSNNNHGVADVGNATIYDNPKLYEQSLAEHRAAIIKSSPKPWDHFLVDDTARAAVIPQMLQAMQQQNKEYSVIDGFPVAERHVRIITLDFNLWQIVLASDGYPFLFPTLSESEEKLEQQHRSDPLNIDSFKATKGFTPGNNSFDDRAYIRIEI